MTHLFLTSQITSVVDHIAEKLGEQVKKPMVYITTSYRYKSEIPGWQPKHRASLVQAGFDPIDYDISGKSEQDLIRDLAHYEIIYIEGGNVFYLLQQARLNNFGSYLKQRVGEGVIYIASSAGSVIVGPDISSASRPGKEPKEYGLTSTTGFGLVNFVVMPHWGAPEKKEAYLNYKIPNSYHEDHPHILLSNHQYIEVVGDSFHIITVNQS
ncbi:MAG: Peptidase E [Microgenomates group bacterium GW2011_GWC2_46_7]|nr:MAG: Peptidase E [Microgenomates group bacterium GW2011_GWC2_46_7]